MQRFQTLERARRHQDGTVNLEPRADSRKMFYRLVHLLIIGCVIANITHPLARRQKIMGQPTTQKAIQHFALISLILH